ncbi:MAG: hypothetical protein IKC11_06245 [Clostridia bacterium]|nr:hypothetical protein [Clostridia bacterium]
MDISKKGLILSLVSIFVCLAVAVVCLVVMKADWVSIVLSAVIVALAVYVCIFCWKVAKDQKKAN